MYDAMALMTPEHVFVTVFGVDGRTYARYLVERGVFLPATLDELLRLGQISPEDHALAVRPRDVVYAEAEATGDYRLLEQRRALHEQARHFHQVAALEQHGPGIAFHLTSDADWNP